MNKSWDQPNSTPIQNLDEYKMKELLFGWYDMQAKLKELKAKEIAVRKELFAHYFPNPIEGTNDFELENGYILKGKRSIERSVEDASFRSSLKEIRSKGIPPESLINYKPSLIKKAYNLLTDEERNYFDQFLIIKKGSPTLEVILPAKNKVE